MPAPPPAHTTRQIAIVLLAYPLSVLGSLIFSPRFHIPLDGVAWLKTSALLAALSFAALWWYAYQHTLKDRTLYAVSTFLALLWFIATLVSTAWLNSRLDRSVPNISQHAITATHISTKPYRCHVSLQPALDQLSSVALQGGYCDLIQAGHDSLELTTHAGALGLRWQRDVRVLKAAKALPESITP